MVSIILWVCNNRFTRWFFGKNHILFWFGDFWFSLNRQPWVEGEQGWLHGGKKKVRYQRVIGKMVYDVVDYLSDCEDLSKVIGHIYPPPNFFSLFPVIVMKRLRLNAHTCFCPTPPSTDNRRMAYLIGMSKLSCYYVTIKFVEKT